MFAHKQQHRIDRRMCAAAARILFDRNSRLDDIEWITPRRQNFGAIVIALAVEHFEEALLVFKRHLIRSEALTRQQRREESAASAMSDMHRLCHRAEVCFDA